MKIFRKEHFGGILYDSETLRYRLISKLETTVDKVIDKQLPDRNDILSAPVRVYFEITRKCNLNCKHCFVDKDNAACKELSQKQIKKILDDFSSKGIIDIRFTGGEPTIRDDWYDLIGYSKSKNFVVSLNTNGVYENPHDVAKQLSIIKPAQVTISIDGLKDNHDYFRGEGSFNKLMNSVKIMFDYGINLRFNTVINKKNINDVPKIIEIANYYAKEINFFYMRPISSAIKLKHLGLDFCEHFRSANETIRLREKYPNLRIMHFEESFIERSIKQNFEFTNLEKAYPYGNTCIAVACDGSVWPHGYSPYQDKRLFLGNLTHDDIGNIWNASERLDSLRIWFRKLIARCQSCNEYMERCAGLNFEMEISKIIGDIEVNPFCISSDPVPSLYESYPG